MLKLSGPYSFNTINNVPEVSGLYAWYAKPVLGKADVECGTDVFLNELDSFSFKVGGDNLYAQLKQRFGVSWDGNLEFEHRKCANTELRNKASSLSLELFLEIVEGFLPYFSKPVYVGMSEKSLRNRLRDHVNEYCAISSKTGGLSSVGASEIFDSLNESFAERAHRARLSSDSLRVFVVPVVSEGLSVDDKNTAIRLAEFCFNNWSMPLLGRA